MVASSRWLVKRRLVGGDGHIAAAVPVQALRVAGIGDDGVGRKEAADDRIIPPCVVEQQARTRILALPGQACPERSRRIVRRRRRAGGVARRAVGHVTQLGVGVEPRPSARQRQRLRAEVVAQQVVGLAGRVASGTAALLTVNAMALTRHSVPADPGNEPPPKWPK